MKYIFSEILTSIHFKMDGKLILKENQSYELKNPISTSAIIFTDSDH